MPSPFPGMDPYLEDPHIWPDLHHRLISEIQTALNPGLKPNYVARVELRVYISNHDDPPRGVIVPDLRIEESTQNGAKKARPSNGAALAVAEPEIIPVLLEDEIKEAYLEIRHRESGTLVTIIELLSPANKIVGSRGRTSLIEKRAETLAGKVHWVEIGLLRVGSPTVMGLGASDYRILMYRDGARKWQYWRIGLRQALPAIGIPLKGKDADIRLDLAMVFNAAYDNAAYDRSIDYRRDPDPALPTADKKWADKLLRERGLR